ncbi:unnamed protein product [Effrenium voratum]|nr:unnamed protein product [Effrenium voratum]
MTREVDDVTVGLMVQQFLDEWHFRVLHSGLAYAWDRPEALVKAMDIFEAAGMRITAEEKEQLAQLNEDWMIEGLVERMPGAMKKTIEHFLLQLQLVLSTATRVRNALEEGSPDEVAKIMEDGDTGITQQVLKEIVAEAGREVGEVQGVHHSWDTSMAGRIARLIRCSEDADNAALELEQVRKSIESFKGLQNAKSQKVLTTMADNEKRALQSSMFFAWQSSHLKGKTEQRLNQKYSTEIEFLETKLLTCKALQLGSVRSVMNRKSAAEQEALLTDTLGAWKRFLQFEKESRETEAKLHAAHSRFSQAKETQKAAAKSSMTRMTAGVEEALVALCVGAWVNWLEDYRKNKAFEDAVKLSEQKVKEYMRRKTDNAREMLMRMQNESEQGLLAQVFDCWTEEYQAERRSKELEAEVVAQKEHLDSITNRRKEVAMSRAKRTCAIEEDITKMHIFMNWYTEVRTEHVRRHYVGKMDTKEQKFEAVQTMIKSFASQLEQGIGNSPRARRTGP